MNARHAEDQHEADEELTLVPLPASDPDSTGAQEALNPAPSDFSLSWQDLAPGEDTVLGDAVTTVRLTNSGDKDVTMVLRLVGDYGTTRTDTINLGETALEASGSVEVPVDLSALYAGKTMKFAGRAHLSASVLDDGIATESVVSGELFYHPVADGVALYDEARLLSAHAAGDISNLSPEALSSEDPEEQATTRIVAFEGASLETEAGTLAQMGQQSRDDSDRLGASRAQGSGFEYELCVKLAVATVDSGFQSSSGVTEDVWPNANVGEEHSANYIRIKVGSTALTTNSSGCVTFTDPALSMTRDVRVWARSDLPNGSYVRVHNGAADTTASYPGSTRSWVVDDVFLALLTS